MTKARCGAIYRALDAISSRPWGTKPLAYRLSFDLSRANQRRTLALGCASSSGGHPNAVPPSGCELVRLELRCANACASRGLARDQGRPPHPHRRAYGIGQDACGLSGCDRRPGSTGSRGRAPRCDAGRLRVAAQGAVERHSSQSRGAAGRHPGATAPERARGCRNPHLGQNGRHARSRARPDAPPSAAHPGDDAGIALRFARLGVRARDAQDRAVGDRRRNPRCRAEQARRASRLVAGEARGAVRRPPAAHWPLRHAKSDSFGCRISWPAPPRTASQPRRLRSSTRDISVGAI